MAEGVGFEPTTPISQGNRLAGDRTRPLCDPSFPCKDNYATYKLTQEMLASRAAYFGILTLFLSINIDIIMQNYLE